MDKIETIEGSVVQHGHHNNRIYLIYLHTADPANLIKTLDVMAIEQGYEKIFAKIPATHWEVFEGEGYIKEAVIPGFFKGESDALFIAKFFSTERKQDIQPARIDSMKWLTTSDLPTHFSAPPIVACKPADADALSSIYRQTFESYPFSIHEPAYIKRMMAKGALYYCVHTNDRIAAVAAAEIDLDSKTCEMTDFATLPEYRGKGFAGMLLGRLDDVARKQGVKTAYTIARADSRGMNHVFREAGYRYAGRLVNNSQIGGRIRSMNVWYRRW